MATPTPKLVLIFKTASDETVQFSYNHIDTEADETDVKNLMNAMVTNKTLFEKEPATLDSAYIRVTTDTPFDLT